MLSVISNTSPSPKVSVHSPEPAATSLGNLGTGPSVALPPLAHPADAQTLSSAGADLGDS